MPSSTCSGRGGQPEYDHSIRQDYGERRDEHCVRGGERDRDEVTSARAGQRFDGSHRQGKHRSIAIMST